MPLWASARRLRQVSYHPGLFVSMSRSHTVTHSQLLQQTHSAFHMIVQYRLPRFLHRTGNHYKWDWPKSQFCMPDDSATVVWLRNLKVGNVYLFNFLQNTLKKLSFWKWEIRKLENVIFPSSAEPCRILQNSALVPQNSAEHFGENHEILRISAEFCGIPQNVFLFRRTILRNYKT